ncbi:heptahelical transmembrane protein 4-like isoform X2 [Lotus japonicus]|uniref:heptahelical transmembrane protein 4-like isoform X2 n=1 Tax=Lotus japonicus TaxID=34305 RepID=UPI00258D1377|nr:heptahelical transmembrane protein 4-like isoform X2 [Lotus japonicus]
MRHLMSGPMKAPTVVDFKSLQNLSKMIRKADLSWNLVEHLTKCLPEQFSLNGVKDDTISTLIVKPITRWPFYAFLGGAMFCLLASSTCHLFACHSQRLSYIMLRIDYAGIAALIATSFYPLVYYSFMCNPFFCYLYLGFITLMGIATIAFSLLPFFQKAEFRKYRASLFFLMGFSGVVPIIHKVILHKHQPEALQTTGYEILMGVLYGLGALIYVTRIPERWRPGKFDIAGHSHQLFHVLVVAGAYTHYQAGLVYLRWRDLKGC